MSRKAAADFVAMAADRPDIKGRARSAGDSLSEERYAQVVSVAKEEGFDFTVEDLKAAVSAAQESRTGELDETDLEAVVGGASGWKYWLGKAMSLLNGGGSDSSTDNAVAGVRG